MDTLLKLLLHVYNIMLNCTNNILSVNETDLQQLIAVLNKKDGGLSILSAIHWSFSHGQQKQQLSKKAVRTSTL